MSNTVMHTFFKQAFGQEVDGYICLAVLRKYSDGKKEMREEFFRYPVEIDNMVATVQRWMAEGDVYYCPNVFNLKRRRKENVELCPTAWADLDECDPHNVLVVPTVSIESSPGRFQALWRFDHPVPATTAEDISKRIAYYHSADGADRSGWDLTQLLRMPLTPNYKYPEQPRVKVIDAAKRLYKPEDFSDYPEVKHHEFLRIPVPAKEDLPVVPAEDVIQKYRQTVNPTAFMLFSTEPEHEWSKELWKLEMLLYEAGMTREEVYYVATHAACNKYRRDHKDPVHLWTEVCRAFIKHHENMNAVIIPGTEMPELLTPEESELASRQEGFVERYIEWASGLGDAAPAYHQAGAFTILSALLSGRVTLPTSYGQIVPNLWFMILGDTTLTRKSTAMELAIELVEEVDPDCVLATDGSIEGLLQQLEGRPKRPSIFLRDEFSGLLEMMQKRDYYAGMAETLTKLYDGKLQKRVLRKETVTVRDPILIILAGGIRNRVQSNLSHEHVASGFVPRFLFVTAESDASRLQPLGPPSYRDLSNRDVLVTEMEDLIGHYEQSRSVHIKVKGENAPKKEAWKAQLTPQAWTRYNKLEAELVAAGLQTDKPDLMTPTFDRLAKSCLKAAVLLAAARQRDDGVSVEEIDILHAIRYGVQWMNYSIEVINGVGQTANERQLDLITKAILRQPGISRAQLMRNYHLDSRKAELIFDTLLQRGTVTMIRQPGTGRQTYFPMQYGRKQSGTIKIARSH